MIDKKKIVETAIDTLNDFFHEDEREHEMSLCEAWDIVYSLLKEHEPKHGEWITIWREDDPDTSDSARCSVCRRISERPTGEYCKWCGAKMDL